MDKEKKVKCKHVIGLIAIGERRIVNDTLRHCYVIAEESTSPDDDPDGEYDVRFTFCPDCGKMMNEPVNQIQTKEE